MDIKFLGRKNPDLQHFVWKRSISAPYPEEMQVIYFGMGCFWGAERLFWPLDGVHITAAGYQGGFLQNPTYEKVCSGHSGHAEVVKIVYDPQKLKINNLLKIFWESHDPTQGLRQGNDIGSQYRSTIYTTTKQQNAAALQSKHQYEAQLLEHGFGPITTEIEMAAPFYFAEEYHQQYLAKNPSGYCGIKGNGVSCQILEK